VTQGHGAPLTGPAHIPFGLCRRRHGSPLTALKS
jgi:hypothetical protein